MPSSGSGVCPTDMHARIEPISSVAAEGGVASCTSDSRAAARLKPKRAKDLYLESSRFSANQQKCSAQSECIFCRVFLSEDTQKKSEVYIRGTSRLVRISALDVYLSGTRELHRAISSMSLWRLFKSCRGAKAHTRFGSVVRAERRRSVTIPGTQGTKNIFAHGVPQYPCRQQPTVACSLLLLAPLSSSLSLFLPGLQKKMSCGVCPLAKTREPRRK